MSDEAGKPRLDVVVGEGTTCRCSTARTIHAHGRGLHLSAEERRLAPIDLEAAVIDFEPERGGNGAIVIRRLHRLVRHGYRPWLGYDVASGQDRDIHLRRKDTTGIIHPDGSVVFQTTVRPHSQQSGGRDPVDARTMTIVGDDDEGFDARFPPNTSNKRNIMRRLYEIGFLAG